MKIGDYEIQVPFVTTSSDTVKDLLILIEHTSVQHAVDLGSGDGRVIVELGRQGIRTTGYEIKEQLVERSRQRMQQMGLSCVDVFHKSFWDVDVGSYDLIYIYGMSTIMGRLEQKLDKEAKTGTRVITNVFKLPHWKVRKQKNYLHLYTKQ